MYLTSNTPVKLELLAIMMCVEVRTHTVQATAIPRYEKTEDNPNAFSELMTVFRDGP